MFKRIIIMCATDLLKAKYTRRTGGPGSYKYEYGEKKGRPTARGKYQEKYLYTGRDYMAKPKKVLIDADGYIVKVDGKTIEPTPVEDYGNFYLSDKPVSDALDRWGEKQEGHKMSSAEMGRQARKLGIAGEPGARENY